MKSCDQLEKTTAYPKVLNTCKHSNALNKGLINDNLCTECKKHDIPLDCTISCGHCNSFFHITCTHDQLHYDVASAIRENPSLWWICLSCISKHPKTNDTVPVQNEGITATVTMKSVDHKIMKALQSFKDEMLSAIDKKVESK